MTTVADEIPEHIWVELILTNGGYEIFVPRSRRTELINAAHEFTKKRYTVHDTHFKSVLASLNSNGSSKEHNSWRRQLNAHIEAVRARNRQDVPGVVIRDVGRIDI